MLDGLMRDTHAFEATSVMESRAMQQALNAKAPEIVQVIRAVQILADTTPQVVGCKYCGGEIREDLGCVHDEDCPVAIARRTLPLLNAQAEMITRTCASWTWARYSRG